MRKRIIDSGPIAVQHRWLDLEQIATIEVTSEDPAFPVEAICATQAGIGWRAAKAGEQTIRLIFDQPQHLRHIQLHFVETIENRTQEFCLRWAGHNAQGEIVRQQWTFSPDGSTTEIEDYTVDLEGVQRLELWIRPDGAGTATATMMSLHVA